MHYRIQKLYYFYFLKLFQYTVFIFVKVTPLGLTWNLEFWLPSLAVCRLKLWLEFYKDFDVGALEKMELT